MWRHPRTRNRSAFTLVEMTVVIVAITLLAGISFYTYDTVRTSSSVSQARDLLRQVSAAQQASYSSRGSFVSYADGETSLADIAPVDGGYGAADTPLTVDDRLRVSIAKGLVEGSVPHVTLATRVEGRCVMRMVFPPSSSRKALEADPDLTDAGGVCHAAAAIAHLTGADTDAGDPPAAPSGVTGTPGPGRISVNWGPVTGADGYRVYRSHDAGLTYRFLSDVAGTTGYTDAGLNDPTAAYSYCVASYNAVGSSAKTCTAAAVNPLDQAAGTIGAPYNVRASQVTETEVTLTWEFNAADAPAGDYDFVVYRTGPDGAATAQIEDGTTWVDTAVTPGHRYTYRVEVTDPLGGANTSSNTVAHVTAPSPPTTPTVTALSASDAGCSSALCVRLAWTVPAPAGPDAEPATDVRIYRTDGAGTRSLAAVVPAAQTTWTDTRLPGSATYDYELRAVNDGGESLTAWDAPAVQTAPAAPAGLAVSPSTESLTATWTTQADADSYQVQIRDSGGTWLTRATATTGAATLTGLAAGTEHQVRVIAVRGTLTGLPSRPVSGKVRPSNEINLRATVDAHRSVTLNWDTATGTSYLVERRVAGGTWAQVDGPLTAGTWTDETVTANTSYGYRIVASNEAGTSTSAEVLAHVAPNSPSQVTASASGTSITLSWSGDLADSYKVIQCAAVAADGTCTPLVDGTERTATVTGASHTFTGLTESTRYSFAVIGYNETTGSETSAGASATTRLSAPGAPAAVSGGTGLELSWTRDPLANHYRVYRQATGGPNEEVARVDNPATGTRVTVKVTTDSDIVPGVAYTVVAFSTAGDANGSAPATFAGAAPPPAAPTGVTAVRVQPDTTRIRLSWTAPTGATTEYRYCTTPCDPRTTGTLASTTAATVTLGLAPGSTYAFSVRTKVGTGAWSAWTSPVTETSVQAPPTAVTATTASLPNGDVRVSWTAAPGAFVTGYRLTALTHDGQTYRTTVANVASTSTTTVLSVGAARGVQVRVVALTSGSESAEVHATASGDVADVHHETTIADLTGLRLTGSTVVSWNAVTGAAGYTVQLCPSTGTCQVVDVAASATSYDFSAYSSWSDAAITVWGYGRHKLTATGSQSLIQPAGKPTIYWVTPSALPSLSATWADYTTSASYLTVSWSAVTPAQGVAEYRIYETTTGSRVLRCSGIDPAATTRACPATGSGFVTNHWTSRTFEIAAFDAGGVEMSSRPGPAMMRPGPATSITAQVVDTGWNVTVKFPDGVEQLRVRTVASNGTAYSWKVYTTGTSAECTLATGTWTCVSPMTGYGWDPGLTYTFEAYLTDDGTVGPTSASTAVTPNYRHVSLANSPFAHFKMETSPDTSLVGGHTLTSAGTFTHPAGLLGTGTQYSGENSKGAISGAAGGSSALYSTWFKSTADSAARPGAFLAAGSGAGDVLALTSGDGPRPTDSWIAASTGTTYGTQGGQTVYGLGGTIITGSAWPTYFPSGDHWLVKDFTLSGSVSGAAFRSICDQGGAAGKTETGGSCSVWVDGVGRGTVTGNPDNRTTTTSHSIGTLEAGRHTILVRYTRNSAESNVRGFAGWLVDGAGTPVVDATGKSVVTDGTWRTPNQQTLHPRHPNFYMPDVAWRVSAGALQNNGTKTGYNRRYWTRTGTPATAEEGQFRAQITTSASANVWALTTRSFACAVYIDNATHGGCKNNVDDAASTQADAMQVGGTVPAGSHVVNIEFEMNGLTTAGGILIWIGSKDMSTVHWAINWGNTSYIEYPGASGSGDRSLAHSEAIQYPPSSMNQGTYTAAALNEMTGDGTQVAVRGRLSSARDAYSAAAGANLFDGAWHHVALLYDYTGNTADVYVDGTLVTTVTLATGFAMTGTHSVGGWTDGSLRLFDSQNGIYDEWATFKNTDPNVLRTLVPKLYAARF